jgi:hypothetical protein
MRSVQQAKYQKVRHPYVIGVFPFFFFCTKSNIGLWK